MPRQTEVNASLNAGFHQHVYLAKQGQDTHPHFLSNLLLRVGYLPSSAHLSSSAIRRNPCRRKLGFLRPLDRLSPLPLGRVPQGQGKGSDLSGSDHFGSDSGRIIFSPTTRIRFGLSIRGFKNEADPKVHPNVGNLSKNLENSEMLFFQAR